MTELLERMLQMIVDALTAGNVEYLKGAKQTRPTDQRLSKSQSRNTSPGCLKRKCRQTLPGESRKPCCS